jgi:hypothetical protein
MFRRGLVLACGKSHCGGKQFWATAFRQAQMHVSVVLRRSSPAYVSSICEESARPIASAGALLHVPASFFEIIRSFSQACKLSVISTQRAIREKDVQDR